MGEWPQIKQSLSDSWHGLLEHLPGIILGLALLLIAIIASGWLAGVVQRRFMKRINDNLLGNFIAKVLRFILVLLSIPLAFQLMGLTGIASGILAGAGLGALVIGLAFQEIGANFLAGIILAFNRPFNVGDTIEIGGTMGRVLALNLRNTHIKTADGKDVYIPNNKIIKDEVINYTRDGLLRQSFTIGIDNNSDIDAVLRLVLDTLLSHSRVLRNPGQKPQVLIQEFAASSINLQIHFWIETFDYRRSALEEKSLIMKSVYESLMEAGVGMPSDIVELKNYESPAFPVRIANKDEN